MKETKLWADSSMSYDCRRDFQTSLVVIGGRRSGVEKYHSYGGFQKTEVYA
jgi:hypothetical protein